MMLDITLRSRFEANAKIKEAIRFLEPDLDIVTKGGTIIRTNKLLLSLNSPFLQNLLTGEKSSSDRIHLPDVWAPGLIHLINVVKNGFTTGLGRGYGVLNEIRDVAEMLGFQDIPFLTFEVPRTNQELVEDDFQNAPEGSHEGVDGDMDGDQNEVVDGIIALQFQQNFECMDNVDASIESGEMLEEDDGVDAIVENVDARKQSGEIEEQAEIVDTVDAHNHLGDNMTEDQDEGADEAGVSMIDEAEINIKIEIDEDTNDPPPPKKRARFSKECEMLKRRACLGKECEVTGNITNTSQEVTEAIPKVLKVEPGLEDNDQDHNIKNEDVPMFPCLDCSKRFSNAGSLLIHSEEHEKKTGKKKCPLCNLTGTRISLLSHIRAKHTKEKLFSCAFCQQLFTTCAYKNRHEKKHSRS